MNWSNAPTNLGFCFGSPSIICLSKLSHYVIMTWCSKELGNKCWTFKLFQFTFLPLFFIVFFETLSPTHVLPLLHLVSHHHSPTSRLFLFPIPHTMTTRLSFCTPQIIHYQPSYPPYPNIWYPGKASIFYGHQRSKSKIHFCPIETARNYSTNDHEHAFWLDMWIQNPIQPRSIQKMKL